MRVVLDTNVCLDLFVFHDPAVAGLRDAMQACRVAALTDAACRAEWERVLAYPRLNLDPGQRRRAMAMFNTRMTPIAAHQTVQSLLPRCRDRDDQKFLELALHGRARWLLSRDDHLLSLGRRTRRAGLFDILTPQAWTAQYFSQPEGADADRRMAGAHTPAPAVNGP